MCIAFLIFFVTSSIFVNLQAKVSANGADTIESKSLAEEKNDSSELLTSLSENDNIITESTQKTKSDSNDTIFLKSKSLEDDICITNSILEESIGIQRVSSTAQSDKVMLSTEEKKVVEAKEKKEAEEKAKKEAEKKKAEAARKAEEARIAKLEKERFRGYHINSAVLTGTSVDANYKGTAIAVSGNDRYILEHLVMGEAGNQGFEGAALVAQCIRDAMVIKGFTSVEQVRESMGYRGSLNFTPNQDVIDAVSYIFDYGGMAVQHQIMYFYAPAVCQSAWHEQQELVIAYGGHRFFR